MIVLRHGFKTYIPRLTIHNCLILENLYGNVLAPLSSVPPLVELCYILSLCIGEEDEDIVYELLDEIENPFMLILDIYEEAGLINQHKEEQQEVEEEDEDTKEDEVIPKFSEYIEDMRQQCMNIGMSRDDFYNSSFKEIEQLVKSIQEQRKQELEQRAMMDYTLAHLFRMATASILSNNIQYPSIEEVYPFLKANKEEEEEVAEQPKERKLGEVDKEAWDDGLTPEQRAEEIAFIRRMEQMEAMNKKLKEKQAKEGMSSE